jgi:hypothetical protein
MRKLRPDGRPRPADFVGHSLMPVVINKPDWGQSKIADRATD